MKENDYRFGNFVCQLREEKGMTQAELAELLDVTPAAVSKWENGESKPRTEKLFELAKLLDVTAEELMNGERKPPPPAMRWRKALLHHQIKNVKFSSSLPA